MVRVKTMFQMMTHLIQMRIKIAKTVNPMKMKSRGRTKILEEAQMFFKLILLMIFLKPTTSQLFLNFQNRRN